jgi:chorismate-pyruvate lyase
MFATASSARRKIKHLPPWGDLLERFYGRLSLPLPSVVHLKKHQVPHPYHGLLVHSNDMTPTLEAFYRHPMRIAVLSREHEDGAYLREVILKPESEARPVEYGVIRICLEHLPAAARRRVLEEKRPLGNILQTEAIPHVSWPQAFFRVEADPHMVRVLRLSQPGSLYGRRNVLLDGSRRLLADVLEVLAPVDNTQPT